MASERGERVGAVDDDTNPGATGQRDQALEPPIPDGRRGEHEVVDAFGGKAFRLGDCRHRQPGGAVLALQPCDRR